MNFLSNSQPETVELGISFVATSCPSNLASHQPLKPLVSASDYHDCRHCLTAKSSFHGSPCNGSITRHLDVAGAIAPVCAMQYRPSLSILIVEPNSVIFAVPPRLNSQWRLNTKNTHLHSLVCSIRPAGNMRFLSEQFSRCQRQGSSAVSYSEGRSRTYEPINHIHLWPTAR